MVLNRKTQVEGNYETVVCTVRMLLMSTSEVKVLPFFGRPQLKCIVRFLQPSEARRHIHNLKARVACRYDLKTALFNFV